MQIQIKTLEMGEMNHRKVSKYELLSVHLYTSWPDLRAALLIRYWPGVHQGDGQHQHGDPKDPGHTHLDLVLFGL